MGDIAHCDTCPLRDPDFEFSYPSFGSWEAYFRHHREVHGRPARGEPERYRLMFDKESP